MPQTVFKANREMKEYIDVYWQQLVLNIFFFN